jgi:ribosomal protein RSM22 (predicted rRNA methylase)
MLDSIPSLINKTFPIPQRFRKALPSQVAELSRLLTNDRGNRSLSYLARPNYLSAYLHYFMPWNLYRLCLLLPNLDFSLSSDSIITDLGCGPLTFASALWIARPDLRTLPLEINCVDRSAPALEAGKKFFEALTSSEEKSTWKINLLREEIDFRKVNRKSTHANLVCAVNIFNEIYEKLSHNNTEGLKRIASNAAELMHNEADSNASILTVEPGVPQSGKFISFLRGKFIELGRLPSSPCTHSEDCPLLREKKKRWCHFAFETTDAPEELQRLSIAAKLPKERLVFSFLLTGGSPAAKTGQVRVISDPFPLPENLFGRYGCSSSGLVLLTGGRNKIEKLSSFKTASPVFAANGERDKKSGALIMRIE